MNPKLPQHAWERWVERWPGQVVIGVALSSVSLAARWALDPILWDRQPYATAYAGVALAT